MERVVGHDSRQPESDVQDADRQHSAEDADQEPEGSCGALTVPHQDGADTVLGAASHESTPGDHWSAVRWVTSCSTLKIRCVAERSPEVCTETSFVTAELSCRRVNVVRTSTLLPSGSP